MILDALPVLFLVAMILAAAYCWIFGLARNVYWYRQMWKSIRPGASLKLNANLLDRLIFGRFAILNNPNALTDEGLNARDKTVAAMKVFGAGVVLIAISLLFDYFVTQIGS